MFFLFNERATPEIYTYLTTLSRPDALPSLSPIESSQREPQNLRWAWWCDQCGGAGSDHQIPERCDHCGDPNVKTEQFLEPAGCRVDWNAQPHADTDQA